MNRALADQLATVVAITVTPFDTAGGLDRPAYTRVVERMVAAGITAITPNGNTSEFYSLEDDEVTESVELTLAAANDDVVVVPGVGHDVARAVRLARAAESAGVPAVMVHQPVHPYKSVQGWVDYHRAIADAVPDLGLVAYVRDPRFTAEALLALTDAVPSLVAVKFAVADPFALPRAIALVGDDRVAWICGLAERWAPFAWAGGARGFTSGLVNVAPELPLMLLARLRAGDQAEALRLWHLLVPMEDLRARRGDENNVSALKEALAQLELTERAVRPPISDLPPEERDEVTQLLKAWSVTV